jgi:transcription elongation factor GreA-like protein
MPPSMPPNPPPSALEPGQFVRHPQCPGWGLGQVQSVAGSRVTVNFEHAGKVLINAALIALEPATP